MQAMWGGILILSEYKLISRQCGHSFPENHCPGLCRLNHITAFYNSVASTPSIGKMTSSQMRLFKGATQYVFFLHVFWDKFYCCGDSVGVSMLPTFAVSGDWVFTSKLHCYGRGCKVGDVVSYIHPLNGPGVNVMKRIIGMPGDFVVRDPTDGTGDMLQVRINYTS